ncbi:Uncharacterised protein [Legionella lansingensis]|uniref:HEAT repeat protein n=1 Tax=Legionella lansingensis TaxID=45067 RepID=A0A0W0VQ08_9GAMM|nr:HEAT repeat domain-containing protein [Legionella lansingensis]KTD22288.1 hypothetical protein Llan_1229 [Legionella lansingensis]SNV50655.1 Uncharacterised protein [Legionella lansingensis]
MNKTLLKLPLSVWGLVMSMHAIAENIVDVYGAEFRVSEEIIRKYANAVGEIEGLLQNAAKTIRHGMVNSEVNKILLKKKLLAEKIKEESDFLFVDFDTVFYPNNKNQYTTIEVVNKTQADRLRFIHPVVNDKNYQSKNDLIDHMINFERLEMELLMNNQLDTRDVSCPVYHCFSGFHHPKLKPYLKVFNAGAIKEKKLIVQTLNHDPHPERRAAAAFLMGHFPHPEEIISLLLPHVNDPYGLVRNNVIRVIAATMAKAKITQIDVIPFLELLDSPEDTDRNKALYVLLTAAESEPTKKVIAQKGGQRLLALLQLKQPNNHEPAYHLFKKISGKDFGEDNVMAWANWLKAQA